MSLNPFVNMVSPHLSPRRAKCEGVTRVFLAGDYCVRVSLLRVGDHDGPMGRPIKDYNNNNN